MRPVEEDDLEVLRQLHNHPSTLNNLTDPTLVTPALQDDWFMGLGEGKNRHYVIENVILSTDTVVALVRISNLDFVNGTVCIGMDTLLTARGKGYAKPCYRLLIDYCFYTLRLNMVYLWVANYNVVAKTIYSSLGFKSCAVLPESLYKDGEYQLQILMHLPEKNWESRRDR